ncbi:hypothetical protein AB6805_03650 [Chitinophaga sp. RCC_12]|uniref:hypothetical protein n=1 Tax=unclassified Chitinophaga TaxID=2619133 RepID=UPI003524C2F4
MKQAKFALTAVALLAVIGGALAFKANRQLKTFYSLGTTVIQGEEVAGCVIPVQLLRTPAAAGAITPYSSTFNSATTTCTVRVNVND